MNVNILAPSRRLTVLSLSAAASVALLLTGCGPSGVGKSSEFFSESSMGVKASPRVANGRNIPKGGGRYQLGQPYKVAGRTFTPKEQPNLDVVGKASWYGSAFHGRKTSNGEVFDQNHLSGAHPTLPLPSYVRVTNVANGQSALVRINDRGPFSGKRILDVSRRTADVLGFVNAGTADVRVQYVGPAPLQGDDTRLLVAAINTPSPLEQNSGSQMAYQNIQVAQNDTPIPPSNVQSAQTALSAVNAVAPAPVQRPTNIPFQILGYGADISASTTELAEVTGTATRVQLGVFYDRAKAESISERFALLGSVDEMAISYNGSLATQLSLSYLRDGVTQDDVQTLANELGLSATVLY